LASLGVFLLSKDGFLLCIGFFFTWGLCAILLIAIKIRSHIVKLDPLARPWWLHTIAGFADVFVFYFIIMHTTGADWYWSNLGDGGSFFVACLAAFCLTAILAVVLAVLLAREKHDDLH
jgi:hypothetical protein